MRNLLHADANNGVRVKVRLKFLFEHYLVSFDDSILCDVITQNESRVVRVHSLHTLCHQLCMIRAYKELTLATKKSKKLFYFIHSCYNKKNSQTKTKVCVRLCVKKKSDTLPPGVFCVC